MDKEVIKTGLIIALIVCIVIASWYIFSDYFNEPNLENENMNLSDNETRGEDLNSNPRNFSGNGGSGGGGGGGGGGGSSGSESGEKKLPSDLYTRECGFYFVEYGVCVGTCPSGLCVSEGRSCYCK